MTRISITMASAALTLSLAPAAHAYAPEPEATAPSQTPALTLAQVDGLCALDLTQALISALNLPTQEQPTPRPAALACNS